MVPSSSYNPMLQKRQEVIKRLENRHNFILKKRRVSNKLDIFETERSIISKGELQSLGRILSTSHNVSSKHSPFDKQADQHILALSQYINSLVAFDEKCEIDVGGNKTIALQRINNLMKVKKPTSGANEVQNGHDQKQVIVNLRKVLVDTKIDDKINIILSKKMISMKIGLVINSDIGLQLEVLRLLLSFHTTRLRLSLETVFNRKISNSHAVLIRFIVENVFNDCSVSQTFRPSNKEAIAKHFLKTTLKLLFLIGKSVEVNAIPNVSRMFNKSSELKEFDTILTELDRQVLGGSSLTFKKALFKIGFDFNFKQTFMDDYDYTVKGFESFSNGIVFAKMIEIVRNRTRNSILSKLRNPKNDRVRKLANVRVVLDEMAKLGLSTEHIQPQVIVRSAKEEILKVLWIILGIEAICIKESPFVRENLSLEQKVLQKCQWYGDKFDVEVPNLKSLYNGVLFTKVWDCMILSKYPFQFSSDPMTRFIEIVKMAESHLCIDRKMALNIGAFSHAFLGNIEIVNEWQKSAKRRH